LCSEEDEDEEDEEPDEEEPEQDEVSLYLFRQIFI
jgi:hypothetical protein